MGIQFWYDYLYFYLLFELAGWQPSGVFITMLAVYDELQTLHLAGERS